MKWQCLTAMLLTLGACAGGEPIPENQASIPFLSNATVRDWEAVDDDAVFIHHRNGKWYRADILGPCTGLPFATVIGFRNERGTPSFNRFSDIIVDGQSCKVTSLVETLPPQSASAEGRRARGIGRDSGTDLTRGERPD